MVEPGVGGFATTTLFPLAEAQSLKMAPGVGFDEGRAVQTKTTKLKVFGRFLLARAQEPSSWRGLILCLSGVVGVAIEPALALHIISAGVSVAGLIGILTADKPDDAAPDAPAAE